MPESWHLLADEWSFHPSTCSHPKSWPACAKAVRSQGCGCPPTPDQDSEQAALWPLNSSSARFTCAYHHCIVLRLQASPGVRESSSPCGVGRGTHGPAEPSAICGHFCLGLGWEFSCKQPFVPLQAEGGAGKRRKRRSCSPAAVFGPGPGLNGDTELPAAWPVHPGAESWAVTC